MLGAMGFMETCALIALAVGFFGGTIFVVFLRWLRGSDIEKRIEKRKAERKRK